MRRSIIFSLSLVAVAAHVLLFATPAYAQGGPPLITDDPGTPGNGKWEINIPFTFERTREKKIQVHVRGIWDTAHFNQNSTSGDINDRMGTWLYWRED